MEHKCLTLSLDMYYWIILTGDLNHYYLLCYRLTFVFLWCKLKAIKEGMEKGRGKEGVILTLVAIASPEKSDIRIISGFASTVL